MEEVTSLVQIELEEILDIRRYLCREIVDIWIGIPRSVHGSLKKCLYRDRLIDFDISPIQDVWVARGVLKRFPILKLVTWYR